MTTTPDDAIDWSKTTWEGSRRFQLEQALKLTVRERRQALEALGELAEPLAAKARARRARETV